jgi:hypothetical protein
VSVVYPYSSDKAAHQARKLLRTASRVLGTADPSGPAGGLLDGALPLPGGDPHYRGSHAFEPRFSELSGGSLAFSVEVPENGPAGSGGAAAATHEVRRLVGDEFGRRAVTWFDRHTDEPRSLARPDSRTAVVSAFDRDGFREAQVTYMCGPWFLEGLPPVAQRIAGAVMTSLPGAEPAFRTIRATRHSGGESMTFRTTSELTLASLGPVMADVGLGAQHQSLTTAVAFALGARYTLPAESALLTFRPVRGGLEMRLDVDLERVPDLPDTIADLLALELSERPRSLRALEQWVAAFSTDDDESPGSLSVLSVTVRSDMSARLSLHIRPRVVLAALPVPVPVPVPPPAADLVGSAAWR